MSHNDAYTRAREGLNQSVEAMNQTMENMNQILDNMSQIYDRIKRDFDFFHSFLIGGRPLEQRFPIPRGMGEDQSFWPPVTPLAIRGPMLIRSDENQALGHFADQEFREMQNHERQWMDVQTRADGNSVTFGCNVVGYAPEELKINVEGDQLVIEGEHKEEHGGQWGHREFTRRIKLPEGVAHDSVQCYLDDKGNLKVQADFHQAEKPPSRQIPIGYKKSQEEQPPKVEDKKAGTSNKDAANQNS